MTTRWAAVFALLLLTTGWPTWVLASGDPCEEWYSWPWGSDPLLLPEEQDGEVPPDTLFWFGAEGAGSDEPGDFPDPALVLVDEDGDAVPVVKHGSFLEASSALVAFRPEVPLSPGSSYSLTATWPVLTDDLYYDEELPETILTRNFVVSSEEPTGPPAPPSVLEIEASTYLSSESGGWCGDREEDRLHINLSEGGRINLVAPLAELGDSGPDDPFANGTLGGTSTEFTLRGEFPPTTRASVRAGSMDLAGNFSGWSDEYSMTMPAAGCSSSRSFDEAGLGLLVLLFGGSLIRRRQTRALLPLLAVGLLGLTLASPGQARAADEDEESEESEEGEEGEGSAESEETPAGAQGADSGEGEGPADAARESGGEDEAPSEPDKASAEQEASPAEQEAAPAEPEASTEPVPAAPDEAPAAQAPAPAEAAEEAASTAAVEDGRAPLALQLHRSTQVWGALSAVGAGVQIGFLVAMPFRAPGALSGALVSMAGWAPALSGLLTSAFLRRALLRSVSLEKLERSLWAGYGTTIGMVALAFTVSLLSGGIGLGLGGSLGISVAVLGIPLSLLTMNITLGVQAEQLKKLRLGKTAQRRSRAPQLLAAGPTGLVLAF